MARLPRLVVAGQAHFVVQRGHGGAPVFADDSDRAAYLAALREAAATERVQVHAHALLPGEVQLLVTPAEPAALSRLMQALGRALSLRRGGAGPDAAAGAVPDRRRCNRKRPHQRSASAGCTA